MITQLNAAADLAAARVLIEAHGLHFEAGYDVLYGIHDDGQLVAVGARAGCVLKMLTVAAAHRGGPLLAELISALVADGLAAGCATLFIYTKPALIRSFEALNFTRLAGQDEAVWLEFGHGLHHWLAARQALQRPGANGALFVDDEPLAGGYRPLFEAAARAVDHLYIFVGGDEDHPERLRLVRAEAGGLANTLVVDVGPYRTGRGLPGYFLPADAPLARIGAELDGCLFASRIAPFFGIVRRYAADQTAAGLVEIPFEFHRTPPPGGYR